MRLLNSLKNPTDFIKNVSALTLLVLAGWGAIAVADTPAVELWEVVSDVTLQVGEPDFMFTVPLQNATGQKAVLHVAPRPIGMRLAPMGQLIRNNEASSQAVRLLDARGRTSSFNASLVCHLITTGGSCLKLGLLKGTFLHFVANH